MDPNGEERPENIQPRNGSAAGENPGDAGPSSLLGQLGPEPQVSEKLLAASERQPGFGALLALDNSFKRAIGCFIILIAVLVALLPKVWRVSPARLPSVRISGLDYFEARSLSKSARAAFAAGDFLKAMATWQAAQAVNPADPEIVRGLLKTAIDEADPPLELGARVVQMSFFLLTLAGTNDADVNLAVRAMAHMEQDDYVNLMGDGRATHLSLEAYAGLAEANLRLGRAARFEELWKARAAELSKDPEASLAYAAWESGWGPSSALLAGRAALEKGMADPDRVVAAKARRLAMVVATVEENADACQRHLEWLVENRRDRVSDHVRLWSLLSATGRGAEAVRLARQLSKPPATPEELVGLAGILESLGLYDDAVKQLQSQLKHFGYRPAVWTQLARLQFALERWDDLRNTAAAMRSATALQGDLDGYSLYLSGMADLHLKRANNAEDEFKAAAGGRFGSPLLAFDAAKHMTAAGYPKLAGQLLRQVEGSFASRAEFWFALSSAAYHDGDAATLSEASRKAYALAPKAPQIANNYAATLLALHETPGEAIQVTLRLQAENPSDRSVAQNHAAALVQNNRLDEAAELLKRWNPEQLPAAEAATVWMTWAEYWLKRRDATQAASAFSHIRPAFLLAPQREWFAAELAKLTKR